MTSLPILNRATVPRTKVTVKGTTRSQRKLAAAVARRPRRPGKVVAPGLLRGRMR
jgi:hypothetical protein